jgi:hypothetical protein
MRRTLRCLGTLVVLSATFVAAQGTPADVCGAITQAEASAALGETVRAPVQGHATVEGGIACVFYGPSVPPGKNPDVPVNHSVRFVLVKGAQATKFFGDYQKKVHAQPVPGLGDQAFYDGFASLSVLKGQAYIRIAVMGGPNYKDAEKKLAATALGRM